MPSTTLPSIPSASQIALDLIPVVLTIGYLIVLVVFACWCVRQERRGWPKRHRR